ncbi:uncharacterized protein ASPGLDRAFT_43118 [Aspergillus glaucus CBS 516.65]|uniref:Uncharacterized protein n=1 Tax=Aspergillus glaucus CBS 516.65 TaxID=1160497 RepID=A0A1L9VVT0_ASPGL|nr:hypothetical protein ASPGLDRAFT_43118 [Aspergillus glaucus CBS 516.65]OJJ88023.1 hypothetical protein ASPGLDRAFT_43118 [Aspergillus glaucus CBS 516.65]
MNGHTCARIGHMSQWSKIIWSDECSVELGKGKKNQWVWRLNYFNEKWGGGKHIIPYTKDKGISIMIWAAIWGGCHTEIYRMIRDKESARREYSSVLFETY